MLARICYSLGIQAVKANAATVCFSGDTSKSAQMEFLVCAYKYGAKVSSENTFRYRSDLRMRMCVLSRVIIRKIKN